jgi:hypothetical protein
MTITHTPRWSLGRGNAVVPSRWQATPKREGGYVVLNPHLGNCYVLRLDEQIATALYHLFGEWLGYEPVDD